MIKFKWLYVGFIGSNDPFGKAAFTTLKERLSNNSEFCFAFTKRIDDIEGTKSEDIEEIFKTLENDQRIKAVVLFVRTSTRISLLEKKTNVTWINFSSTAVQEIT